MRRRHLLALVIRALVVATVLVVEPVPVWDWLTTKTVEEYYDDGTLRYRGWVRLWEARPAAPLGWWVLGRDCDAWYENGQKVVVARYSPVERVRGWSETGQLLSNRVAGTGILTVTTAAGELLEQVRYKDDVVVETRFSPPWFTEEEILGSVEGVQE